MEAELAAMEGIAMQLTTQEKSLFALARERITIGHLPSVVPASLWAGPGSGAPCSLCGHTIEPEQIEYELSGYDGVRFRFHMRCHTIWQLAADDRISGS